MEMTILSLRREERFVMEGIGRGREPGDPEAALHDPCTNRRIDAAGDESDGWFPLHTPKKDG